MGQQTASPNRILNLVSTAIATAYASSAAIPGGHGDSWLRFFWDIVLAAGSAVGTVTLNIQGSRDGTVWYDLCSTDDGDVSDVGPAHDFTVTVPTTGIGGSVVIDGTYPYYRAQIKANAAGHAGDTLNVYAQSRY